MAKKKHECPEPENTERWAVSYLDMITVMMYLLLVFYAISQIDAGKLVKLSKSLAAGFNQSLQVISPLHTTSGLGLLSGSTSTANLGSMIGNDTITAAGQPECIQAMAEASHLNQIKQQVEQALATAGQTGALQMCITEKGLVLEMMTGDTYFKPGNTEVQPIAQVVLAALAPVLAGTPEDVAIEGYADPNPQCPAKYPSNYHLTTGCAIEVPIYFRNGGVPGSKLHTVSYGTDHQTQVEAGQDAWSLNWRVDIVIVSRTRDSVRAMLPEAAKQLSQGLPQAPTDPQIPQIGPNAGGDGNAPETSGTSNQTGKNGGTLRSEVRTVN